MKKGVLVLVLASFMILLQGVYAYNCVAGGDVWGETTVNEKAACDVILGIQQNYFDPNCVTPLKCSGVTKCFPENIGWPQDLKKVKRICENMAATAFYGVDCDFSDTKVFGCCGDSILDNEPGINNPEECDDGNLIDNDGCSNNCTNQSSCSMAGYFKTDRAWLYSMKIDSEEYEKKINVAGIPYDVITPYDDLICSADVESCSLDVSNLDSSFSIIDELGNVIATQQGSCVETGDFSTNYQGTYNCQASFQAPENGWQRGTKLICEGKVDFDQDDLYSSEETFSAEKVVAKYVFHFIPEGGSKDNAKQQVDYFISISKVNSAVSLALKPVFYIETGGTANMDMDYDRQIYYVKYGDLEYGLAGTTNIFTLEIEITDVDIFTLSHELGHTKFEGKYLADEYLYRDYKRQKKRSKPLNDYPSCCVDAPGPCEGVMGKNGKCLTKAAYERDAYYSANYVAVGRGKDYWCDYNEHCFVPMNNLVNLGNNCLPDNVWMVRNDSRGMHINRLCSGMPISRDGKIVFKPEANNNIGNVRKADNNYPGGRSTMGSTTIPHIEFYVSQDTSLRNIEICPLTKC